MEILGIAAIVVAGLSAAGVVAVTLRAFAISDRGGVASDRLIDAAYERAGLLVKVSELKSANLHLFEQHVQDTREIDDLRHVATDWQNAYESILAEVEGDDDDPDDGEWPDDGDDPGPDDEDGADADSGDGEKSVTDEMIRPSPASREWLKSNDIEWGDDDPR